MMKRLATFWAVLILTSCVSAPSPSAPPSIEVTFLPPAHTLSECLPGMGESLRDLPDGVVFYEHDSNLKVRFPSGGRKESYHVHLFHRVGEERIEQVVEGARSPIELDLAKYPNPEFLIVTSASARVKSTRPEPQPIIPAYAMSFRMMPKDDAARRIGCQSFRHEIETPRGRLDLLVQPMNRGDMLLSMWDLSKQLTPLFEEGGPTTHGMLDEAYVYCSFQSPVSSSQTGKRGAYVIPRLVVEVSEKEWVWGRVGSWPRVQREDQEEYSLRMGRWELARFAAPAGVEFRRGEGPAGERALYTAMFKAGSQIPDSRFQKRHLILATGAPKGERARVSMQRHEVTGKEAAALFVGVEGLSPGEYPVRAYVAHRFVEEWNSAEGAQVKALGRHEPKALDALPSIWGEVAVAGYASHYEWVRLSGPGAGDSHDDGFAILGGGVSANLLPPPAASPVVASGTNEQKPPQVAMGGIAMPGRKKQWGPGGGGPKPKDDKKKKPGEWDILAPCGSSKAGCGMDEKDCKCGKHQWSYRDIMSAALKQFRGATDIQLDGLYGTDEGAPNTGLAPCHTRTEILTLRVFYWVGAELRYESFRVFITFAPCVYIPKEEIAKKEKDKPFVPDTKSETTTGLCQLDHPTTSAPFNDPDAPGLGFLAYVRPQEPIFFVPTAFFNKEYRDSLRDRDAERKMREAYWGRNEKEKDWFTQPEFRESPLWERDYAPPPVVEEAPPIYEPPYSFSP